MTWGRGFIGCVLVTVLAGCTGAPAGPTPSADPGPAASGTAMPTECPDGFAEALAAAYEAQPVAADGATAEVTELPPDALLDGILAEPLAEGCIVGVLVEVDDGVMGQWIAVTAGSSIDEVRDILLAEGMTSPPGVPYAYENEDGGASLFMVGSSEAHAALPLDWEAHFPAGEVLILSSSPPGGV